jgi:hypothetical protein
MANTDDARGFKLVDTLDSGNVTGFQEYTVDSANATAIFKGDPITLEADGGVKPSAAGDGVLVAAVAMGFKNSAGQSISYLPATTAGTITGIPVRGKLFVVQASTGVALTQAAINATADFVTGTGDTTTGVSKYELNSTIGGNQLRIINLYPESGNEFAEHAKLLVQFVENAYEDANSI